MPVLERPDWMEGEDERDVLSVDDADWLTPSTPTRSPSDVMAGIKITPQLVNQPSMFSSGMGNLVPPSENPDWAFTRAASQGAGEGLRAAGRGFDRAGKALGDVAKAYAFEAIGEPTLQAQQLGINVPGEEMPEIPPWTQGKEMLPAPLRALSSGAEGLIESAPRIAAVAGAQALGIPAWAAGGAVFGTTAEGFDPEQAAIGAVLPSVGKYSGVIAESIAQKLGVSSKVALGILEKAGEATGGAGLLTADAAAHIMQLPEEQRKGAWIDAIGNSAGMFAMSFMGGKKKNEPVTTREPNAKTIRSEQPIQARQEAQVQRGLSESTQRGLAEPQQGAEVVVPEKVAEKGRTQDVTPEAQDIIKKVSEATGASNKDSLAAGLKLKSVADLEALKTAFEKMQGTKESIAEFKAKLNAEPDFSKKMEMMQKQAGKNPQYLREAIETATNSGAWEEGAGTFAKSYGERPLDWRKNPEVKAWLEKNGKTIWREEEVDGVPIGENPSLTDFKNKAASELKVPSKPAAELKVEAPAKTAADQGLKFVGETNIGDGQKIRHFDRLDGKGTFAVESTATPAEIAAKSAETAAKFEPAEARPFFDRQSEAQGLERPSTTPTVEDVRRQRAADETADNLSSISTEPIDPATGNPLSATDALVNKLETPSRQASPTGLTGEVGKMIEREGDRVGERTAEPQNPPTGEPPTYDLGTGETTPDGKRHQVAGVPGIGSEYTPEVIKKVKQSVREKVWNGSRAPTPKTTAEAWQLIQELTDPKTRQAKAQSIRDATGADMGPGLALNELWTHALKVAAKGDTKMLRHIVENYAEFEQFGTGGGSLSTAGKALRTGGELASNPLWGGLKLVFQAEKEGGKKITTEKLSKLAEIDEKLANPDALPHERVKLTNQIYKTLKSSQGKPEIRKELAAYYSNNALSGTGTALLQILTPGFNLAVRSLNSMGNFLTGAARGNFDTSRMVLEAKSLVEGLKGFGSEFKYAHKNDSYTLQQASAVEHISNLHNLMERGSENWNNKSASPMVRAKGLLQMIGASTDIVRTTWSSLDQAWGSTIELQQKNLAGFEALKDAGLTPKESKQLVLDTYLKTEDYYNQATARGLKPNDATIEARDKVQRDLDNILAAKVGHKKVAEIKGTAEREAELELGFHEGEGGISQRVMQWIEGFKKVDPLLYRMVMGFPRVGFNMVSRSAWYSPYGWKRLGVDYWQRKQGEETQYQKSMGSEMQRRQRLSETIAGTAGFAALAALWFSDKDKPDEEKKIWFDFNAPLNPQKRAKWFAEGHKPMTLGIKAPGTDRRVHVNWNRGGLEALQVPIAITALAENARANGKDTDFISQIPDFASLVFSPYGARREYYTGRTVASTAVSKAAPIIPFSGLLRTANKLAAARDTTSIKGASLSSTPLIGAITGHPALNFFGDETSGGPANWSFRLGLPVNVKPTREGDDLKAYSIIQKFGMTPTFPNRPQIEKRYGELTDPQWYDFRKDVGQRIKKNVVSNYDALNRLDDPAMVNSMLDSWSDAANLAASQKLKPKK